MRSLATGRRCLGVAALVTALAGPGGPAVAAESRAGDELRREFDALGQEQAALELALAAAARRVPVEPETAALETRLRRFAEVAGVEVDFRPLADAETPALRDGSPGPLRLDRVELAGRGELARLAALLSHIEVGVSRLLDLEQLEVTRESGLPRFVARLLCPTWAAGSAPAATPAGDARALVAARRVEVERLRQRVAALDSWTARAADGRLAAAADLLDALGKLDRAEVTALRIGERIELAGATLGVAARAALAGTIESAGFAVTAAAAPAAGACRPFHFALAPPARASRWFPPAARAIDPDPGAIARCATEPRPPARPRAASGDSGRPDAFTLRARGLALADLFRLLHEATGEGFAVAAEIRGEVDVDFDDITPAEALAALAPLGLAVSEGPIRLVTDGLPIAPRADAWAGEPASFAFARLPVSALLCLVREAFGLESRLPPDLDARITLFVRDQPWDLLLVRALESAGLAWTLVDNVAHVAPPERLAAGTAGTWLPACEAASAADTDLERPLASETLDLTDLEPGDLRLAALFHRPGGERQAWAYGPFGRVFPLAVGAPLHRAQVAAIASDAVLFGNDDGSTTRLDLDR